MGRKTDNIKITKTILAASLPREKDYVVWDCVITGFGFRVRKGGSRRFIFYYRHPVGGQRWMTLGNVDSLELEDARTSAKKLVGRIADGEDPAETKRIGKLERATSVAQITIDAIIPAAKSFAELSDRFLAENTKLGGKTKYDYRRWLENDITPEIGDLIADNMVEDDIQDIVDRIAKKKATTARRCGELISSIFGWAIKAKIRDKKLGNPARGVDLPPQKLIDNALRRKHLGLMWEAIDEMDAKIDGVVSGYAIDIIRLALLTGARKGELREIKPEQLDLDRKVLTLDRGEHKTGEQIKNGTGIKTIILSDAAVEILRPCADADDGREYTFHGAKLHDPISETQTTKVFEKVRARARQKKGFPKGQFRFHDLRHTFASIGLANGVSLAKIGGLLGHTNSATTQRYTHHDNDALRADANLIGDAITPK